MMSDSPPLTCIRLMGGRDRGRAMRLAAEYLGFDANHAFWENEDMQVCRCEALEQAAARLQESGDKAIEDAIKVALERGQPLEHLRSRWKHFADRARDCPAAPASARVVEATTSAEDDAPAFMPN